MSGRDGAERLALPGQDPRPHPSQAHGVAAVVPVIDEVKAIGGVVRGLRAAGVCCAFTVDGGSSDGTPEAVAAAGGIVVHEPRRGYGRACLTGAEVAVVDSRHRTVVFLDGDGSCDPADVPALVAALDRGADVAFGRRRSRVETGAVPWHAAAGNALVAGLISVRTGRRVHDLSPMKALRSEALEGLALDATGYAWTVQLVARSLRDRRLETIEVPVGFRRRVGGRSKVSGSLRASIAAGRAMFGAAWRETRPRPIVVLMAKAPREGHAKTRLASRIGPAPAAQLWTASLGDVAATLRAGADGRAVALDVMVAEPSDVAPVVAIVGTRFRPLVQPQPGLHEALVAAFLAAYDEGADRAVAVAGDSPTLRFAGIEAALAALDRNAAVLGPCEDGGYYLVGLRLRGGPQLGRGRPRGDPLSGCAVGGRATLERRLRAVFGTRATAGQRAMDTTRRAIEAQGGRVTLLETLPDIDTVEDLDNLAGDLAADGRQAPLTTAWIADRYDRHPNG